MVFAGTAPGFVPADAAVMSAGPTGTTTGAVVWPGPGMVLETGSCVGTGPVEACALGKAVEASEAVVDPT
jgi:hypothetical protein